MNSEKLILDGTRVAKSLNETLVERINQLSARDILPCLATIFVGDDPSSETYVRMKSSACKRLGIDSRRNHLNKATTTEELIKEGAIVMDAGSNAGNVGDVDYKACHIKASAITPVPAGIGPVTIAMLLKHTILAAEKSKITT